MKTKCYVTHGPLESGIWNLCKRVAVRNPGTLLMGYEKFVIWQLGVLLSESPRSPSFPTQIRPKSAEPSAAETKNLHPTLRTITSFGPSPHTTKLSRS